MVSNFVWLKKVQMIFLFKFMHSLIGTWLILFNCKIELRSHFQVGCPPYPLQCLLWCQLYAKVELIVSWFEIFVEPMRSLGPWNSKEFQNKCILCHAESLLTNLKLKVNFRFLSLWLSLLLKFCWLLCLKVQLGHFMCLNLELAFVQI